LSEATFLPGARADLLEGLGHYRDQSPRVAQRLLAEVRRVVRFVETHPLASPRVRGDVRRRSLLRFPYSLIYYLDGESVVVVALAHHRRRPDYWHGRI